MFTLSLFILINRKNAPSKKDFGYKPSPLLGRSNDWNIKISGDGLILIYFSLSSLPNQSTPPSFDFNPILLTLSSCSYIHTLVTIRGHITWTHGCGRWWTDRRFASSWCWFPMPPSRPSRSWGLVQLLHNLYNTSEKKKKKLANLTII